VVVDAVVPRKHLAAPRRLNLCDVHPRERASLRIPQEQRCEDDQRKRHSGDSVGMICAVQERGHILQVMVKAILCNEGERL